MSPFVHHKRKFFDFFPTPKYLEMPSVGIDISEQVVRFVEICDNESRKQRFSLKVIGEKKIPDDVVSAGNINKPEEVQKILKEIQRQHHFGFINVSLPEEKSYLFKTELPSIEEKYFSENIELRLEENVPIEATKCVFDYNLVKSRDVVGRTEAVVTVLPNRVIEEYSNLFKDTSLLPVYYEMTTQSVARAVISQDDLETCLVIHIGYTQAFFGIVSNGVLQFSSTISIGRAVEQLDIEKRRVLLKNEVSKLRSYWRDRNENESFKKVIISGKDAFAPGLKEYLADAAGCPVNLANVWVNVFSFSDQIPEMSLEDSLDYAPAIGLAISRFYHA